MNYFRRAHSKEVTIFHRRLLFLTQWLSVIYLTIFLFTNYVSSLDFFSFHKSFAYLAFYIPILTKFYIYAHCHKTYPPNLKAQTLTFLYTGFALLDYRQVLTPSLKIRTANAICLNSLGLFRDYSLNYIFLGIKLFLFFKIES